MFAPKVSKPQTKAAESSSSSLAPRNATFFGDQLDSDPVDENLRLQRTIGNQASRNFSSSGDQNRSGSANGHKYDAASERMMAGARLHGASWDFSKIPLFPPDRANQRTEAATASRAIPPLIQGLMPRLQAKLKVNTPGDQYEQEADRVAEQVMSIPAAAPNVAAPGMSRTASGVQRKCSCGGSCDKCKQEEKQMVQRSASAPAAEPYAPPTIHEVLRSSGQPLDVATRAFMEPRFGHDFRSVRVHTDSHAAASAEKIHARAYTAGQHLVFAANHFSPQTSGGRRLLAHELTHVIQQSNPRWHGAKLPDGVGKADTIHERHADSVAERVVAGHSAASMLPSGRDANTETGGGESRAIQRASALIPPEKVQDVYDAWVREFLKAGDNINVKALNEKVKNQVGPGNFANWQKWQRELHDQDVAVDETKAPPPLDAQGQLRVRRDQMWEATKQLRAEIVRVEYLAQQLNFGSGVKGTGARLTAGGYTALWGVGARTVSSVTEHAPMFALGAAGMVFGSERAERTLIEHGQAVKQEGGEMGEDVHTGVRLVGGALQAEYEATRPSYKKYQKAFSDFSEASRKFNKDGELEGLAGFAAQARDIDEMDEAMKAMREAGNEYLMACAKLGIENEAQALDKMGGRIVQGAQEASVTAATILLGEAQVGEALSAFKGPKGLNAKQLERAAADEVSALTGSGEREAAKDASRSGLKATKDVGMKPDLPPDAGPPAAGAHANAPDVGKSDVGPKVAPDKAPKYEPPKIKPPQAPEPPSVEGKPPAKPMENLNDPTREMLNKPENKGLKEALEDNSRAAQALKKCASPCWPEWAKPKQIKRIERIIARAEKEGASVDYDRLREVLRDPAIQDFRALDGAIDAVEQNFKEAEARAAHIAEQTAGGKFDPNTQPETGVNVRRSPGGRQPRVKSQVGQWTHKHAELLQTDPTVLERLTKETGKQGVFNKPLPEGLIPEYEIPHPDYPNKPRIDRLWRQKNKVIEIKPNTKSALVGEPQARQYAEWLDKYEPLPDGQKWGWDVIEYDQNAMEKFLTGIGVLP